MKFVAIAIAGLATSVDGRCDFDMSKELTTPGNLLNNDKDLTTLNKLVGDGIRKIQNKGMSWQNQGPGEVWTYYYKLKPGANPADAKCEFKTWAFAEGQNNATPGFSSQVSILHANSFSHDARMSVYDSQLTVCPQCEGDGPQVMTNPNGKSAYDDWENKPKSHMLTGSTWWTDYPNIVAVQDGTETYFQQDFKMSKPTLLTKKWVTTDVKAFPELLLQIQLLNMDYVEVYEGEGVEEAKKGSATAICDKKLSDVETQFTAYKTEVATAHEKLRAYVRSHKL